MTRETSPTPPTPSPPTARVVTIVHFLAGAREPRTVTEISTTLGLSRSTVSAVVGELVTSGWVLRRADGRYSIGAGIVGAASAARANFGLTEFGGRALDSLARRTGRAVALSLIEDAHHTVIDMYGAPEHYAAATVGVRVPFVEASGVSVMARRTRDEQELWLDRWPPAQRRTARALLDESAAAGVTICAPAQPDVELIERAEELLAEFRRDPYLPETKSEALQAMTLLAGRPYTASELAVPTPLPVTYMAAPVFDADAYAQFEINLGVLAEDVDPQSRYALAGQLRETAAAISAVVPSTRTRASGREVSRVARADQRAGRR